MTIRQRQLLPDVLSESHSLVGISLLSGAHLALTAAVRQSLDRHGADDIPLVIGGIPPDDDYDELRRLGAEAIFTPGASIHDIERVIRELHNSRSRR